MKEFKKCPFCGSDDIRVIFKIENGSPKTFRAVCMNCCAEGPFHLSEQTAKFAWNIRN